VLRDAMRSRLAAQIINGPKTGFGVPYEHWRHGYARANILARTFVDRFRLDLTRLVTALDHHRGGRRDRGFLLWKLVQLALWSARYLP
jgi:asparagine synthase (glutamine-hydrolysing)